MSGETKATDQHQDGDPQGARAVPLGQIEDPKEEILRLRDLLIAKDAELGAARGRLAEFEQSSLHIVASLSRLRSVTPKFIWSAASALRRRLRR